MIIAEVCKYAPKYAGNFIDSLLSIESVAKERNVEIKLLFLFPMSAQNLDWVSKLAVTHKVFFVPSGRIQENIFISKICRQESGCCACTFLWDDFFFSCGMAYSYKSNQSLP